MFAPEKRTRRVVMMGLAACAVLIGMADPRTGQASRLRATAPTLGTAASFAVLGGSTVTNTGATTVNGNLGVSPGSAVTGFPPGIVNGGTIHAADAVAAQAQSDANTAYNSLAGQPCDFSLTGQDLGGKTLVSGVYCFSSSAQLTGSLTLNGQGNPNAVFIFQIGSTLTTASASSVLLINGAQSCNVFWQVGSSATLGTGTAFAGSIIALTSNTLTTGARVNGRALARNGAVTLDTNQVSSPVCGTPATVTAPGPLTLTPVVPVVVVNTAVPTATSTSTAVAATSTAAAATSTAVAAISTAVAAISTAVTAPSAVGAATSTAVAATSTAVAATSTAVAATTLTPTATATVVPATSTEAVPTQTPTPTSGKKKTPASTSTTAAPAVLAASVTVKPVKPPTIPMTGAGGTYVYSSARASKLNRAALISGASASLPATGGAVGSNPTSPLAPVALLVAAAVLAGRTVRRLRK
jgi:hypothetical protein